MTTADIGLKTAAQKASNALPLKGANDRRSIMKKMWKKMKQLFNNEVSSRELHHASMAALRAGVMDRELQYSLNCNDLYARQDFKTHRID